MTNSNVSIATSIEIDDELKTRIAEQEKLESQVVIHCRYFTQTKFDAIRIWDSTYLYDNHSDHISKLLFNYGIAKYPKWLYTGSRKVIEFTLIFSALPNDCITFNLIEKVGLSEDGFKVLNIEKNNTNVYYVDVE